ncbi:class IV lanthionine synthetase LanL [Nocardiopsis sp. EMB25]|uniref:class IV lanthionine synthetase LanL n=1 Tax=Nocardiopsis sp. EMB25 TaxID=2835867 RepID=UPI0022835D1F|nr:class IV lanthionine synthetase LanL [Nocardiopsis sp. EMB25]MCY9783755.1 class IV lanthionine synthetase LanL [Nocardiopsis sp. EMB25]
MREHDSTRTRTPALEERLRRAGRVITDHTTWTDVTLPNLELPPQGWKIHISARPTTLVETLGRALPLLLRTPCRFKFARTTEILRELNSHRSRPGAVGKAVTVYPPREHFTDLAEKLAAELAGLEGPRVHSDRRIRPDAPVYYRYAPFEATHATDDNGDLHLVVHDDQGRARPGGADGRYHAPTWIPDPFTGRLPAPETAAPSPVLLGGRFLVPGAIAHTAAGGVYRATDTTTGQAVVVKERRAHTDEDPTGTRDARHRLRAEAAVLRRLEGIDGIPSVVDHFRHGADEFLATTDLGPRDLRTDVATHGTHTTTGRDPDRLAVRLSRLVDAVHARGVLIRDLAPKNVVITEQGHPCLVDFEISHTLDAPDPHPPRGWTPGYSPPEQEHGAPARLEDDLYSLGATLLYAVTGVDPPSRATRAVPDDGRARTILAALGDRTPAVAGVIPDLMSPDPARRVHAMELLRSGHAPQPPSADPRYTVTPAGVDALVTTALDQTHETARALLTGRDRSPAGAPSPTNQYQGAAGIGVELLRHHDPRSRSLAHALAHWTSGFLALRPTPPGLQLGSCGTAVFLATAARELDDPTLTDAVRPLARTVPETVSSTDHTSGLAGITLAQLHLWRLTGDQTRLDLARRGARLLIDTGSAATVRACPPDPDDHDATTSHLGLAHGLAGVTHALLCLDAAVGDPAARAEATAGLEVLAHLLPPLLEQADHATARPMTLASCQGLAGIGTVLLHGGSHTGQPHLTELAVSAARRCRAHAPRVAVTGQCCGLAGVGEFLLDTATHTGDTAHRDAALDVAGLILVRSDGTPDAPVFLDHTREPGGGWASGVAGVLAFLRRLARGGPRDWWGDIPHAPDM